MRPHVSTALKKEKENKLEKQPPVSRRKEIINIRKEIQKINRTETGFLKIQNWQTLSQTEKKEWRLKIGNERRAIPTEASEIKRIDHGLLWAVPHNKWSSLEEIDKIQEGCNLAKLNQEWKSWIDHRGKFKKPSVKRSPNKWVPMQTLPDIQRRMETSQS